MASNYYTGLDVIEYTAPSSLAVGGTYTEPITGSTVVRRTDITTLTPDLPADAMIVYSRFSPINSNGQYAIVHGTDSTSAWVLRLSDNAVLHKINPGSIVAASGDEIGETHEIRWDYSGVYPNRIYFVYGMKFYYMDVIDGNDASTLIRDFSADFPSGVKIQNGVEGDSSNDSRYWAWQVKSAYTGSYFPLIAIFTYDKQTNTILGTLEPGDVIPTQNAANWVSEMPRPNMVEISPCGTKIITHYGRSYTGSGTQDFDGTYFDGPFAWNKDFSGTPVQISVGETHSGWAWDADGNALFISQRNAFVNGVADVFEACRIDVGPYPDNAVVFLDHEEIGYAGVHFAKMPASKPGFILTSFAVKGDNNWSANTLYPSGSYITRGDYTYYSSAGGTSGGTEPIWPTTVGTYFSDGTISWKCWGLAWPQNSLVMLEIKPIAESPAVWRITPSYNQFTGNYRDESSAAISLDGNSIWWTGNWDNATTGHGEVLSVDLPSDWLTQMGGTAPEGDTTVPVVTPSITGGRYGSTQTMTLAADETATIRYSTSLAGLPTTPSTVYSGAIKLLQNVALHAISYNATDISGNTSDTVTEVFRKQRAR